MKLNTSLNFDGQCREAFEFYAAVLGGEIKAMLTYGELPEMKDAADGRDRIAHAWLEVGDQSLMGGDAPTPAFVEPVGGFSVALHADDAAEGGTVVMPVSATSWSPAFGMLKDRFGVPWMVNAVG